MTCSFTMHITCLFHFIIDFNTSSVIQYRVKIMKLLWRWKFLIPKGHLYKEHWFSIFTGFWLDIPSSLYQTTNDWSFVVRDVEGMFCSIGCFYVFSFSRVGICLLALHYSSEALFHAARLIYFLDKAENGSKGTGFIIVKVAIYELSMPFWNCKSINVMNWLWPDVTSCFSWLPGSKCSFCLGSSGFYHSLRPYILVWLVSEW